METDCNSALRLRQEIQSEHFWNNLNDRINLVIEINNRQIESKLKSLSNELDYRLHNMYNSTEFNLSFNYKRTLTTHELCYFVEPIILSQYNHKLKIWI